MPFTPRLHSTRVEREREREENRGLLVCRDHNRAIVVTEIPLEIVGKGENQTPVPCARLLLIRLLRKISFWNSFSNEGRRALLGVRIYGKQWTVISLGG